jgi:4-hydroxybenzoate polyprenyltransferase
MPASVRGWRRLWQPRRPAFWLALGFNLASSALVLAFHTLVLAEPVRWLLLGLALVNSALGWWWTLRLWRATDASGSGV